MAKAKYKNPKGGLTQAGRDYYKRTQGSNLKPGVKNYSKASEADKKRWVRWALRFAGRSTIPPLKKPNGEPTRFALMFAAWGEPVPSSVESVRKVYKKAQARRDQLGMGKAAKKINAEDKSFSLTKDDIHLSIKIPVESGNPYRDPSTGKFSFGIPGVRFYAGLSLFKNLPKGTKDLITQKILGFGGNVVGLRQSGDKINVVVLKDGRLLGRFAVDLNSQVVRTEENALETGEEKVTTNFSGKEKDVIVDAARNLDLVDGKLEEFLAQNLEIEITPAVIAELSAQVESQRADDLISYLNSNMVRKEESMDDSKTVRIRTPRGYLRKIFSIVKDDQVLDIIQRLQAKGWSEEKLESDVISQMPKRLKSQFATTSKKEEGDNEEKSDSATER
jgi:hypothetical protein